jgi:hypothetical protein
LRNQGKGKIIGRVSMKNTDSKMINSLQNIYINTLRDSLVANHLHNSSNDTFKRDIDAKYKSKVEMFDPKEFDNDSNYSDSSITNSLK